MTIQVGDTLPSVNLTTMTEEGPKPVSLNAISAGKKVVLFAVPGAFTPTCSAQHLPGFIEKNAEIKEKGVDIVACVSVNDPFVMKAWGEDRNVGQDVLMLSDGNGEFTAAIGLEMDGSGFGLGIAKDLNLLYSYTTPLGPGNNYFDSNVKYSRKPIYSSSLNSSEKYSENLDILFKILKT